MIRFTKEKVLLLHQLMAEATGGSVGVRDVALLDSALESIFQTFAGEEFYPTKEEKGARLGYNLISNHAFVDGNKRIGMYLMLVFLEVNGIRLYCNDDEVVNAGLSVADGSMGYVKLLEWVREHEEYPNKSSISAMLEEKRAAEEAAKKENADMDDLFKDFM